MTTCTVKKETGKLDKAAPLAELLKFLDLGERFLIFKYYSSSDRERDFSNIINTYILISPPPAS